MSFILRNFGKCLSEKVITSLKNIRSTTINLRTNEIKYVRVLTLRQYGDYVSRLNNDALTSNILYRNNNSKTNRFFVPAGILTFLGLQKDDPEEEPALIKTIKRGILLIQKEEYKKAEQMFHIALKIAQEQQNHDGITYIYDLLANLAYEQGEFSKAEKLFVNVMQRLMSNGVLQTDNKIIHISLKLANIYKIQKDTRKAEEGFKFCVTNLEKNIDQGISDEDTLTLWAMTLDWYARFLVEMNRHSEALTYFKKAYDLCVRLYGNRHEETVVLLNDLGTVCFVQNELDQAVSYLTQAVEIGHTLPDMQDFGSILVNLGTVYMKKGMYKEARDLYEEAQRNARKHNNDVLLKDAHTCLDELKILENV